MVDYIAVFSDPAQGREEARVDYLLEPGDDNEADPEKEGKP